MIHICPDEIQALALLLAHLTSHPFALLHATWRSLCHRVRRPS